MCLNVYSFAPAGCSIAWFPVPGTELDIIYSIAWFPVPGTELDIICS